MAERGFVATLPAGSEKLAIADKRVDIGEAVQWAEDICSTGNSVVLVMPVVATGVGTGARRKFHAG